MVEKNQGGRTYIYFFMFCILSQNFFILPQNQLSSDKLFLFTLQLAVVTAHMFTMERFIEFYFELGLYKVIVHSVVLQ